MDLPAPSNSSTSRSNRKRKSQDSNVVRSKRGRKQEKCHKFYSTYKRQDFSMPDSVIFHMTKNPNNAKMYQKMIQTCKHFFIKNPILVIPSIVYTYRKWCDSRNDFRLPNATSKFWITDQFYCSPTKATFKNPISSLIPKLFRFNAKILSVANQAIYYHDLRLPSAEDIRMHSVSIKHENGLSVALENVVEIAVKAKEIVM
uniref:Uncharacterized protein n=1 Tax=Panagrolaimus davidi TaxID=227884 RepID=A0A914PK85_9BILA